LSRLRNQKLENLGRQLDMWIQNLISISLQALLRAMDITLDSTCLPIMIASSSQENASLSIGKMRKISIKSDYQNSIKQTIKEEIEKEKRKLSKVSTKSQASLNSKEPLL